jgi:hypothetical protein
MTQLNPTHVASSARCGVIEHRLGFSSDDQAALGVTDRLLSENGRIGERKHHTGQRDSCMYSLLGTLLGAAGASTDFLSES